MAWKKLSERPKSYAQVMREAKAAAKVKPPTKQPAPEHVGNDDTLRRARSTLAADKWQ